MAWRLAAAAPQRVDRLVLVDAAGYTFDTGSLPLGWRLARLPGVNRLMEHLLPRPLVVSGLIDVYADPKRISEELVDRYFELTLREGNRKALGQRLRQYELGAGAAQIATLKLPTLILWGGLDHLIPPDHAEHFHHDIAGSSVKMFATLGHVPHEEDPAATVAPVLEFLNPKP